MVHIAAYDTSAETSKYWNEVQLRFQPMFSHWNWQGKDSVRLLTFTNCEEVELFVNGKSVGTKQIPEEYYNKKITGLTAEEYNPEKPLLTGPKTHKKLEWIIPYQAGTIKAESKMNGKVVANHELKTSGSPFKILLEADREIIHADGLDLSYITVKVVDNDGIIVPDANHLITFTVKGAGTNAGVGNADLLSDESFVSNHRKAFQGQALLIIRAERKPGSIIIKATAEGLKDGLLKITNEQNFQLK
jgi:beta-galactosidase